MLGHCGVCGKVCKTEKTKLNDIGVEVEVYVSDCCRGDVYRDSELLDPITPEDDEL